MTEIATGAPLYRKSLGCLVGGLVGDAMGTPTENMAYGDIEEKYGWVDDFDSDGTLNADESARRSAFETTFSSSVIGSLWLTPERLSTRRSARAWIATSSTTSRR